MTSIVPKEQSSESKKDLSTEEHEDFRLFGLIAFLIADGMTFAGFLPHISLSKQSILLVLMLSMN